jgi:hypothetical protein
MILNNPIHSLTTKGDSIRVSFFVHSCIVSFIVTGITVIYITIKKFGIVKYIPVLCIVMLYFTIILVNIIISAVIANSAKSREISQTNAFIVSFLLSPLVGMFVVAMSPVRKETLESETVMDIDYPQEDGVVNFMSNYLGNIIWIVFVIFIIYQLFHTTGEQPIM